MAPPRLRYPIMDEHHMNGLILLDKIAECHSMSNVSSGEEHMTKDIFVQTSRKTKRRQRL
jgi:hypothetical protein